MKIRAHRQSGHGPSHIEQSWTQYILKQKKTIGLKTQSIGSNTQKKANKIAKFFINAVFISVEATFYKSELLKNLVILFAFFCAFEPIDCVFKPIDFFCFNLYGFLMDLHLNTYSWL